MWSSNLTSTIRSGPGWPRSKDQQENEPPASPRDNLPKVSRTCICGMGEACKALSIAFAAFKEDPRGRFVVVPQAKYEAFWTNVRPKQEVDLASYTDPCYIGAHHFDPEVLGRCQPHGQQEDLLLLPTVTKMWHEEALPNYAFDRAHQDLRQAMRQHLKEVEAQSKQKRELRKSRRQEMLQIAAKRMSKSRRTSKSRVTPLVVVQDNDNKKVMAAKSVGGSSTAKEQQQRQHQSVTQPAISPASSFRIEMKPTFETAQEGEIELFLDTDEEREAEIEKVKAEKEKETQPEGFKPKQPPKRKVSCPAKEVKGAPAFTPRARTPQPPGLGDGECIEVVLEEIFARNVNFFDDISSSRLQGSHQQHNRDSNAHLETYSPERRATPTEDPPAKAATLATDPPGTMDGSSARQRDSTASARNNMDGSEKHQPFQPRALPSFRPISPTPPTQDKPKVKLQSMDMPFVPVVETVGSSDLESSSHHARSPTLASVKTAPSMPTPESQTPSEPTPKAGNPFLGNFFDEGMVAHDSASQFGNPFDQVVADTNANPFATAAKSQPSPFETTVPNPFDTERVIRSAPSTGAETFATAGEDTFATAKDPFDDTPLSPTKSVQSNPFAATSPPNPFDSVGANETADAAAAAAALGVFEDFPTKVLQPTASFAERVFEDSVQGQQVAKKQQEEEFLVQPRSKEPASSELPLTPTMSPLEDEAEDASVSELQGEFLMPDPPAAEPSEREEEKEEIEAFKSADQEEMEEEALMRDTIPEPIVASQSYDTCEEEKEEEIVIQPMTTGEMARSIATADSSGIVSVPLTPIRGFEHAPEGAPRSAFATPLHETPPRASAFMTPRQTAEKTPKSAPRALFGPSDTKGLFSGENEDAKPQPAGLGGFQEGEEPLEDDFRNLLRASHVVVQSSDQSSNLDSSGHQDDIDLGGVSSTAGDEHSMDSKPKMIFVSQAESEKAARGELEVEPSICYHNNPRNIVIFYGCMVLLAVGNVHYGNVLKEQRILEEEMAALEMPPVPVSLEEPTAAPWASTDGGEEVNPLADVDMEPESEVLAPEMVDEATPIEGDSETKPTKSSWFWRSSPAPASSEGGEKETTGAVADQDSAVDEVDSETKTDILPEENTEAGSPSEKVEVPTPKSSWFWRSSPTSSPGDATLVDDKALPDDIGDSASDSGELTRADASAENIETEVSGSVANPSLEVPTDEAPKKKSSSWFWRSSSQADIAGSDTSAEEVETTMDVSSPEASEEAGSAQTESREKEGNLQESVDSVSGTAEGQSSDRNVQIDELPAGAQTKKKSSWFSWGSSEDSSADKPLGAEEKTDASGGTEDIDSSKAGAEIESGMDSANGELPLSKEHDDIGASYYMNTSDDLEQGNPAPPTKEEKKSSWFWSTSPSSSPTSESQATTSSIEEDTIAEKTAVTSEEDTAASTSAISDTGTEQETLEVDGTADLQVEGESTNSSEGGNHMIEESTTAEKGGKSSWWWGKSAPRAPTDGEGLGSEGSEIDVLGAEQDVALPDGSSVEASEMARSIEIEGSGAAVSESADLAEINSLEEEHTNQTVAGAVEDVDGTQGQGEENEDQTKESANEEGKESSSSWFWGRSSPKATKINADESLDSSSSTDAKDHTADESSSGVKDADQGDDDASTKKSRSDANSMEEDIKSTNEEESSSAATSSDSMETPEVTSGPNVDQVKSTANDNAKSKKSRSIWASRDSSEEPTHEVIDLDSSSDETEEVTSSGQDENSGDTAEEAMVEHGKQKDSLSVKGEGTRREDTQEDLQSTAGDGVKVPTNGEEGLAEDIQSGEASSTETPNLDETSDNKPNTIDAEELVKLQGDDISVADSSETTPAEKESSWIWRKLGMASSGDDAVKQNEMAGITSSATSSSGNVDILEGTSAQSDAVSMETTEESIEGALISQDNAAITTPGPVDLEESALRGATAESAGEQVAAAEDHSDEKQQEEKATSWWQYFKSSEKKEKEPLTVDSAASDVSSDDAAGDVHGVPVVELPDSSDGVSESLEEEVSTEERSHDSTKEDVETHSGDQSLLGDNEDSVSAGPATLDSDELSDAPTAEPMGTPPTWQRVFKPTSAEKSDESILGDEPVEELNEDGPSNDEGFPVNSDQPYSGEDHQNLRGENTGDNIKESDIEGLGDMKETSFGAQTEANTIEENEATPETEAVADTDQSSGMDQSNVLEPGAVETGESTGAWSLRGSLGSLASSAKSYIYSASKNEQHVQGLDESSDTESNDNPAVVEEKASLGGEDVTSPDSEITTLEGEEATGDVTKEDSLAASEDADLTEKKEEADTAKVTGLPEESAPKEESGWQWTNKLRKVVGLESERPSEDITMGKARGEDSTDAQRQGEESVSEVVESVASGREVTEKTEESGLPSAPSDVAGLNGESTAESVEPDLQEVTKEDSITEDESSGAEESTAEGGEEPASTAGLLDKWKGMANSFADYAKYTKSTPPSDDKEAAVETQDVASEPDSAAPSDQEEVVDEDSMPTIEVEDTAGDESVDEDSLESDTPLVGEPNKEGQMQELAQDTRQGEINTDSSDMKETPLESETESETTADSNDVVLEPMEAILSDKTASADQGVKDTSSQQQVLGTVDDAASNKLKEFWIRAIVRWYNSGFALESVLLVLGAYFYWGRG